MNGYNQYGHSRDSWVPSRGIDQLKNIVKTLKERPEDRRMLCLSWNPLALNYAALPACHVLWNINVIGNKLHLTWYQRSVDFPIGAPYNLASYALLLHLLSLESGIESGTLTGFLTNVHYYENQLPGVIEILERNSEYDLPKIETKDFKSIFEWEHSQSKVIGYSSLPKIDIPIAV